MSQTSVESAMTIGRAGGLADSGHHDIITRINNSKQRVSVTMTAIDLATTLTINGTAFTVNSGAAAKTKTELRDLLIIAVNAGSEPVTASINDADELFVDADVSGTLFTAVGTTNCSVADVILNETNVPFGVLVVEDTTGLSDERAHLPQATGDITTVGKVAGLAIHTHAVEQNKGGINNLGYEPQSAMSVMRKGRAYVEVEDAVVKGGLPFVRFVAGAGEQLGAFRSDADTADAVALPDARFVTSAGAGELAIVEINLP
ncbi:MAG: hypothetical protein KAJ55_10590 [Anaerolineales bacterium]|nr:hypothetical protein [Anaerolineales bacterium]